MKNSLKCKIRGRTEEGIYFDDISYFDNCKYVLATTTKKINHKPINKVLVLSEGKTYE